MAANSSTGTNIPIIPGLPTYNTEALPFPSQTPPNFTLEDEPFVFDPKVHLQLEPPAWIRPLKTDHGPDEFKYPVSQDDSTFAGLAFSAPFKMLSEEGVRCMRALADRNEKNAIAVDRQPKMVRGTGYRSKFICDLAYDKSLVEFLSNIAGEQITPENHPMNLPQINFGQIGKKRMVDKWHLDSVPYVIVLILSDLDGMVGGELKVARLQDASYALELVRIGKLPDEVCENVVYPGVGHAIFMQGSKIAHCVTPVIKGKEQRITCVLSFQNRNVFADPKFIYNTFVNCKDPLNVLHAEHSRHIAWRIKGQMDYLIANPQWEDSSTIVSVLDNAQKELDFAKKLITGEVVDKLPYKTGTAEGDLQSDVTVPSKM